MRDKDISFVFEIEEKIYWKFFVWKMNRLKRILTSRGQLSIMFLSLTADNKKMFFLRKMHQKRKKNKENWFNFSKKRKFPSFVIFQFDSSTIISALGVFNPFYCLLYVCLTFDSSDMICDGLNVRPSIFLYKSNGRVDKRY